MPRQGSRISWKKLPRERQAQSLRPQRAQAPANNPWQQRFDLRRYFENDCQNQLGE
jgi:hypothetical protein